MILTDYGSTQYINGTLNFKYFSLDDSDVIYNDLSGTSTTNISSSLAETEIAYIPVMEPFEALSSSGDPNIPTICDYDQRNSYVPQVMVYSATTQSLGIMYNDELNNLINDPETDEDIKATVAKAIIDGDIKREDIYKNDVLDITTKVYAGGEEINGLYDTTISAKRIDNDRPLLIRNTSWEIVGEKNMYSVGEYGNDPKTNKQTFREYLKIKLPGGIDASNIKHQLKDIMERTQFGLKTPVSVLEQMTGKQLTMFAKATGSAETKKEEEKGKKTPFGAPTKAR